MSLKECPSCKGNMLQDIEDQIKFYCISCQREYYDVFEIQKERREYEETESLYYEKESYVEDLVSNLAEIDNLTSNMLENLDEYKSRGIVFLWNKVYENIKEIKALSTGW